MSTHLPSATPRGTLAPSWKLDVHIPWSAHVSRPEARELHPATAGQPQSAASRKDPFAPGSGHSDRPIPVDPLPVMAPLKKVLVAHVLGGGYAGLSRLSAPSSGRASAELNGNPRPSGTAAALRLGRIIAQPRDAHNRATTSTKAHRHHETMGCRSEDRAPRSFRLALQDLENETLPPHRAGKVAGTVISLEKTSHTLLALR